MSKYIKVLLAYVCALAGIALGLGLLNVRDNIAMLCGFIACMGSILLAIYATDLFAFQRRQFAKNKDGNMGAFAAIVAAVIFAFVGLVAWISGTSIRTGFVGVRVVEMGANAGVQDRELGVGWYFPQWGSHILKFPTTTQTEIWADNDQRAIGSAIRFRNSDGVQTAVAVSVQLRIDPTKASNAVQRYRMGFNEMIQGPVQRDLQDAFIRHGLAVSSDNLMRHGASDVLEQVRLTMNQRLSSEGLIIESINLIGSPALPESILTRINERIEAEQNAATQEQQVRVVEARGRQTVAQAQAAAQADIEAARGRAQAMDVEGEALRRNPQVVQLRMLERWNGLCPIEADVCAPGANLIQSTNNNN